MDIDAQRSRSRSNAHARTVTFRTAALVATLLAHVPGLAASQAAPAATDAPPVPATTPNAPENAAAAATPSPTVTPAPAAAPAPTAAPVPAAPAPAAAPASAWTFTPSAQVRLRGESRINGYSPVVREDEYFVTSRVRVGLNVTWNRLRLFAQAQDVRSLGDTLPGNDGGSAFGIHQGFAEVGFDQGYVRVGRQEIAYGSERFLGPLDWASSARSFDGARVHINPIHKIEFDAFGAITRGESTYLVGPPANTTIGDYFVASQLAYLHSPALRLEGNYFYRHDGPTAALPTRLRTIHAPTIRLSGNVKEGLVRYDLEGTMQFGDANGQNHFAYGAAGDVFVRLGAATRPTLDGGFSYATGRSANGHVDELENFFPTNHKLYGYMDLFGLRNVITGHLGLTHRFASANLLIGARAWEAFLQTTNGTARWSNAVGATLGTGQGGSRHLGTEADFWATYKPYQFLSFTAGYSIFAAGAAAESMGHGDTQHWIWLQLDVTTL